MNDNLIESILADVYSKLESAKQGLNELDKYANGEDLAYLSELKTDLDKLINKLN